MLKQGMSVLYAAMKGLEDLPASDNFCHLLISYANSLDSIRPKKCWARSEFKLFDTDSLYRNK